MGALCFQVPNAEKLDPRVWETAYVTGIEGIPWPCTITLAGSKFSIAREIDESGKLHIVWPTESFGNVSLMTTSLRVDGQDYHLPLELARGTVIRLRNQVFEWQRVGLKVPSEALHLNDQALDRFVVAATSDDTALERTTAAQQAIEAGLKAASLLCDSFSTQLLDVRKQNENRLATLLGVTLPPALALDSVADALCTAFNMITMPLDLATVEQNSGKRDFTPFDKQIEWARQNNMRVSCGPLMNFRAGGLPRWMVLLGEGFESVLQAACNHAEETVNRYRGKVHLWNCCTGLNVPGEMGWNDEQVLRMAVSLIQTVRRTDPRSPVLLSIDQPWSEYLRASHDGISPLHFADALIRADLGLSGLALDLNLNSWPDGSLPRDPLEISRMIDRWAVLGLPLMVTVTMPSSTTTDEQCTADRETVSTWTSQGKDGVSDKTGFSPESILRLLAAKQCVHAMNYNQSTDQLPHEFPNAGLWDNQGRPKPLLSQLARFRQSYLA
ncbi:MAG: hypothetical protein U0892_04620 [Pirellulales bacterium]